MTGSDELPADALNDALVEFTGAVGTAVDGICSYGLTVGSSYVPFTPDEEDGCEEGEEICSQLWVRVTSVNPIVHDTGFDGGDCATELQIGLEVGILRCFDIPEGGEAPFASDVMMAAFQSMQDMQAIHCAAMSTEVWASISSGSWVPDGPLGGQYGGVWTFSVVL